MVLGVVSVPGAVPVRPLGYCNGYGTEYGTSTQTVRGLFGRGALGTTSNSVLFNQFESGIDALPCGFVQRRIVSRPYVGPYVGRSSVRSRV